MTGNRVSKVSESRFPLHRTQGVIRTGIFNDRYGGLRKVRETSSCCKDRDEELIRLQEELEKALDEAKEWEQLLSTTSWW